MKTVHNFLSLAVLGLVAFLSPTLCAQSNPPQKPKESAHAARTQAGHTKAPAPVAHPAVAQAAQPQKGVPKASKPASAKVSNPKASKPAPGSYQPKIPRLAKKEAKPEPRKTAHKVVARKPVPAAAPLASQPAPAKPVVAVVAKPAPAVESVVSRRDPFAPLIEVSVGGRTTGEHLPPGIGGLVVATVRVDGTVEAPAGTLAVVSNPDDRVYFVRVGDQLYDGDVEKINLDGVTFKENSRDAFGHSVERLVTKRIYPNAGDQQ
jgi:Tfp pilus assembly protein PilP